MIIGDRNAAHAFNRLRKPRVAYLLVERVGGVNVAGRSSARVEPRHPTSCCKLCE
jgi:hypothetical protein